MIVQTYGTTNCSQTFFRNRLSLQKHFFILELIDGCKTILFLKLYNMFKANLFYSSHRTYSFQIVPCHFFFVQSISFFSFCLPGLFSFVVVSVLRRYYFLDVGQELEAGMIDWCSVCVGYVLSRWEYLSFGPRRLKLASAPHWTEDRETCRTERYLTCTEYQLSEARGFLNGSKGREWRPRAEYFRHSDTPLVPPKPQSTPCEAAGQKMICRCFVFCWLRFSCLCSLCFISIYKHKTKLGSFLTKPFW